MARSAINTWFYTIVLYGIQLYGSELSKPDGLHILFMVGSTNNNESTELWTLLSRQFMQLDNYFEINHKDVKLNLIHISLSITMLPCSIFP